MQNSPAQRHSKMSNLKIETENSLPQRHSKMSNGRLSGLLCRPHGQKAILTKIVKNIVGRFMSILDYGASGQGKVSPAQRGSKNSKLEFPLCLCDSVVKAVQQDSGISKLGMGLVRVIGAMGLMGGKPEKQISPAQWDSEMSILPENQTLHSIHELHDEKLYSAQQDSEMYIFPFFWDWRHLKKSFSRHIIYCTYKIQQGF